VEEEEEKEVMMKMMRMNELKMREMTSTKSMGRNIYFESIDFFEGNCRHMTVSCPSLVIRHGC
jgi:hypothetical protein